MFTISTDHYYTVLHRHGLAVEMFDARVDRADEEIDADLVEKVAEKGTTEVAQWDLAFEEIERQMFEIGIIPENSPKFFDK